jgi:hemoglobin/transferrin/lactoferrin receptor protein
MRSDLLRFSILAATAAISTTETQAQQADTLDEIQVTATRRPVESSKLSAALTLISAQEVQSGKLTTDALAAEVGVFLQQTTPGQGAAIVRGLKGSEVLHMVDGMRLNNAIFRNAPTQYLALVSPATVERIEIVRGSPTSLYGSDAVGGVLQVITRTPTFDSREMAYRGDFSLGFDTAELGKLARASFEAGTDRVAGLLSVDYLETGDRRTGDGERIGPSGYSARGARAALSLTPDDGSAWLFDFQSARQPETPRIDELVPGFGQTEPSSSEFSFEPNGRDFVHIRHTRDDSFLAANWQFDLGWQHIIDDRRSRNFESVIRRTESNESDLFGISVNANRTFGETTWVAGTEYYHDIVSSTRFEEDLTTGIVNAVPSRFPDGSTVDQAAVFANVSHPISERHHMNGGVRYSFFNIDLAQTALSPSTSLDFDDISADIGWLFDLTDTKQIVANLGYGFRAPNVFDLGTLGERPGNRFNIPNSGLTSERVTMIETGLKHQGDKLSGEFIAWFMDYDDRLTSVSTGDVTADGRDIVQTQNRAKAQIWGFEAALTYLLSERAIVEVVLNQTRGEQEQSDGSMVPADRIPPFNGRLSIDLAINELLHVDTFILFASEQDRLSPRDVDDVRIDPLGTDGWVTVNVVAIWQPGDNWTLRLGIDNALDESYRTHGSGMDAPGRNLFLNARFRW